MSALARTLAIAALAALIAGAIGYVAGSAVRASPAIVDEREPTADEGADDPLAPDIDRAALDACEARLATTEQALAQRPAAEGPAIDPSMLSEEARAAIASPEVSRMIESEVERRIGERFERERARRAEEWAARRAEQRERMRAIGIDDATLSEVTPAMCAIRNVFREAWRSGRGGGGAADGGVRMRRRELREATQPMREEVETAIGPERMARLEEEGGLRALGGAIECDDEGGPPGRPR